jgi:hypothetical protein
MKFLILTLGLTLVSCGQYEGTGSKGSALGELRAISSPLKVGSSDKSNIASICDALGRNEAVLPDAVNSILSYSFSQNDCSGNFIDGGNVDVVVQSSGTNFVLKRKTDNQNFIFPDVETRSFGILKDICEAQSNLTNPIVKDGNISYFTTNGITSSDCKPVAGEIGILIEKAKPEGSFYSIHTKEWLRIRTNSTNNEKIGFVTQRKKLTQGFCGKDEALSFQASLR